MLECVIQALLPLQRNHMIEKYPNYTVNVGFKYELDLMINAAFN